jgi:outer membrane protein assembly factor BamB
MRAWLAMTLLSWLAQATSSAADWPRFRGPNGSGISPDGKSVPTEWSEDKNVKWKTPLPGAGASSPIVTGSRVFVTCWSGSGSDMKRHLVCVDRGSGKILWERAVPAKLPEDRSEHGYASHTPATDGKKVYAFFGKSGVFAFDLDGKQLWQADAGSGLSARGWGSSSSPILFQQTLIVTASAESGAVCAFDTETGKLRWKSEAEGCSDVWGTPAIATANGRADIVLSVPGKIWGINPESGKLSWHCEGLRNDSVCSSVLTGGEISYVFGDRGAGSLAIKSGGKDDVSDTHTVWTGDSGTRISTPLLWEGRLYWIAGSLANCRDAATGKQIYAERIPGGFASSGERPPEFGRPGGRGPGGGGPGGNDYASPVAAGGYLYQVTRRGETLVVKLGPTFTLVARNRIASDDADFSATPAISDGQLFIRSSRNLYCIAESKP